MRGGHKKEVSATSLVWLAILLIFPALAVLELARIFDRRLVFGYVLAVSVVTYLLYWHDKQQARSGEWRTPETTLHLAELFGGWPGAFLAQRTIRHKISKPSYQVTFGMIIALYEFTAFDFVQEFQYSGRLLLFLLR